MFLQFILIIHGKSFFMEPIVTGYERKGQSCPYWREPDFAGTICRCLVWPGIKSAISHSKTDALPLAIKEFYVLY